jgi:hypothetical protein
MVAARPRRKPRAASGCASELPMPLGRSASASKAKRVITEYPGGGGRHGIHGLQGLHHDPAQVSGPPRGEQVGEVKRLVELIRANELGQPRSGGDPGFRHQNPIPGVGGRYFMPCLVNLVNAILVPEWRAIGIAFGGL